MDATATGIYSGDISIVNNDADENPYNFRITGFVTTRFPVYRFSRGSTGGHFYTISEAEKDGIVAVHSPNWLFEWPAYYAFPSTRK